MASLRIAKVNELIKREVATTIFREVELPPGSLATVTRVQAEADLKTAKIFLMIFPERYAKSVLEIIRKRAGSVQHVLNRRLAMHFVPQLSFYLDAKKTDADNEGGQDDVDTILDSLHDS